jgi:hypothetical protein
LDCRLLSGYSLMPPYIRNSIIIMAVMSRSYE